MKKVALVTGSNRGIGHEIVKQLAEKDFSVVLTARDPKTGQNTAEGFRKSGRDVRFHELDVTSQKSIEKIMSFIDKEFGRLDVLVNNAGIFPDRSSDESPLTIKIETIQKGLETNLFGPIRFCQLAIPIMRKNKYGRIINISSGMGQLSEMAGGSLAYRISKTALNAVTKVFAFEVDGQNILINSVCPGWVKTDMGGAGAEKSVEDGADTIVWLATMPDGSPSGGFFQDRKSIPW
jgi:NAD(P)-dependent dehydrogenase (short-subunit alcohol dehydrogenase family)